ncbi:MAG TPA: alpha/beta fold hydrolase [Anaerolineae bacterium]|nr:alpha/beta fold hydrolase [Anaerolineae bacterium]HQK15162.1 alpha/beta fold hydrolase [Anaerolineae bacterium]
MAYTLRNPHLEGTTFFWEGGPVGVLLSHGYTATTAEVRPLGHYLHERGYTVSGPLLPGHGTTPQEMNRCRWQTWADAFEAAYRDLAARCDRVYVGGESMGGLLALYLASRHPEIAGVMAYAAALIVPSSFARTFLLPILAPLGIILAKGPSEPNAADARWQGYDHNPLRATQQLFALQTVVRARLSEITQPILIVQGRLDTAVSADAPELIYRSVRSTEKYLYWFEKSTHCVLLDQEWEDVAALTVRFIEGKLVQ